MSDSDPLFDTNDKVSKKDKKAKKILTDDDDDFASMVRDFFRNLNIRVALFLFITGVIIFNDIFVNNVLNLMNDTVYNGTATSKGVIVQLMFLVIAYLIIDLLVQGDVL